MSKPVTLQDMANRLGISKVSVSKALRGQADIGKVTTEKVLALAQELGYRPNILAQKLSAKHTRTIGLVVPKIAHHFLTQAIDAIYISANEQNYEIVMMVSEENAELERKHIETLLSMRVDGLLISVTEKTIETDIFHQVVDSGTPLVFFDRVIEGQGFVCIRSADEQGAADLVECAINKGYSSFGHIGGYQQVSISKHRYHGFLRALDAHGLKPAEKHLVFGGFSRSDGISGLDKLLEQDSLPEIIFAVTYPVALGILLRSRELGIRIPGDLDLVCFGNSEYNNLITPSVTGINQPAAEIGTLALTHLLQQIENPEKAPELNIIVPVEINQGRTCMGPGKKA
ncbi:MAG: LacI family DNA-binding transcriptional regulator [Candidatus Marinimicrobia bacterium]|jgi:LacI family transcriptional regulator|nr:LacI family DNA-binding transcriptional regulator [Candidatus Neomarinimicrobiota bacterium]MBT4035305.1 LacI family DNA-binding transcriptional regulator [Candidatus Neomarinimicrobiota bacterium]MBT4359722.1 LacI family DNA-binding transcriptional regulator [Candidatus Neomarinimicrobiota bacterium]MBT4713734.1 LacI family DNA-binding transcriptional regulator [Candidatus Neomarinimicrobiota bacterium]MBT4946914.1 LacI family DNA-binding transcriptional regulator [Candidatus Neomarinimicro